MELLLEVVSRQKFSENFKQQHVFGKVGGDIGRSSECEWPLPDKNRRISRKHALISCDGKNFYIRDESANGILCPLNKELIGKSAPHKIEHGESYIIGDYTLQARLLRNPGAYVERDILPMSSEELVSESNTLDLDPLVAMEQQEFNDARQRMGLYDDFLLNEQKEESTEHDHTKPIFDNLPNFSAIPENWDKIVTATDAQPWTIDNHPVSSSAVSPAAAEKSLPPLIAPAPKEEFLSVPETDVFFKGLGFSNIPKDPKERERILCVAAELLSAAVDGMIQSLHNRAESKNDLRLPITTIRLAGNNPLKFSPTAQVALEQLLMPKEPGSLPAAKAMYAAFDDLHSHNMGLLAGARAAVRAALDKVSPETVGARLDDNGPVRVARTSRLWHTFRRIHGALLNDHNGFAAFFLQDFARAYELQARTLHSETSKDKHGRER